MIAGVIQRSSPKWRMSENPHRFFSDTQSCTALGAAVRPAVMVRSLGTIKPEGTHKERSQIKRIALSLEVCTTTATETSSARR